MTRRLWTGGPAVLLAAALVAAGCGGGGDGEPRPVETAEATGQPESGASDTAGATGRDDADDSSAAAGDGAEAPGDEAEPLLAPVDTTTTTIPASAELVPQSGGTLRVAVEAEGDGLNPAANNFAASAYVMAHPLFDPVAYTDAEGNWVPFLAESFTKKDDGTVWQMKLREGVRFHDGTELDADDVIATVEAQLADPVISLVYRGTVDAEQFIRKLDQYTVELSLASPSARFPLSLTAQVGMILPSEWLELAAQDETLNQMPVGQGPFMIESRVQDEKTVLVRNPDYWAADLIDVHLDRIEIYPITDMVVAAERLAAGALDMVVTTNAEATLIMRETDNVRTIENVRASEGFAVINSQRPPFDDIRARQALTFASDRDAYVALIRQGTSPPADTMFHPELVWHDPDLKQETNMPERAGPLVAEYCADFPENCSGGRINMDLTFGGPSVENTRIAEVQADAWEDYFDVELVEVLQDKMINDVVLGNFNVVNWRGFGAISPDSDILWLECSSVSFIALNFPRYCDPERDELMYESRRIDDLDRRVEIWHRVAEMIRDAYTYIFYYHTNWVVGVRDGVHDVCGLVSPDGAEMMCNKSGRVLLHGVWLG